MKMSLPATPEGRGRQRPREADDAELMRGLVAGDLGALGVLYDRYHEVVRQFLRRALPDPADVEDLLQETFLALPHAAVSYDGRPRASPFLIGIAAHLVRRRRRFLARWTELLREVEELCADVVSTPEEKLQSVQELAGIDAALARLSEGKRLVYLMVERESMTGEEVAAALGIPVGTVWTRLHHARTALSRSLAKRGKR
jgi:RNA polymerase sigma-70 factor (ECF subfamily)